MTVARSRTYAAAVATAALALSLAGCDSPTGIEPVLALSAAAARWEATAPTSYRFTLEKYCLCQNATPLRVTVLNGVVLRAQVIATSDFLVGPDLADVMTIPRVFGVLALNVDLPAAAFSARYDPVWGFPTEASINPNPGFDNYITFRLSDFAVLP